jgi:serine/threonine protein kinase
MSEFDHPNVLTLIGVCLDGGPAPYIIMPFMENGSLLSYLINERDTLVVEPGVTVSEIVVRKYTVNAGC